MTSLATTCPPRVPQDITLCLFRVLQEALQNAAKHSGVRQFDARLWGTSDEIHLMVRDCGGRKAEGLGINRMEERLKLVKGRLSIESQPKRGTANGIGASVSTSLVGKPNRSATICRGLHGLYTVEAVESVPDANRAYLSLR